MKKIISTLLLILSLTFLTGCEQVKGVWDRIRGIKTEQVGEKFKDIRDNVKAEITNAREQIETTQENIAELNDRLQKTKSAIEGSISEMGEAVDSVKKVRDVLGGDKTKDEENTPAQPAESSE